MCSTFSVTTCTHMLVFYNHCK